MVLCQQDHCGHLGQMWQGVPREVLPDRQNHCSYGTISNFQQASNESIPEAWVRLQEYILACLYHGMDNWLILQNFYNGLTQSSRDHVDAAVVELSSR